MYCLVEQINDSFEFSCPFLYYYCSIILHSFSSRLCIMHMITFCILSAPLSTWKQINIFSWFLKFNSQLLHYTLYMLRRFRFPNILCVSLLYQKETAQPTTLSLSLSLTHFACVRILVDNFAIWISRRTMWQKWMLYAN